MLPDVTLREITAQSLGAVLALEVAPGQRHLVATNARSIAQAHFSPQAWFRAVHAGEDPVGFVMLAVAPGDPDVGLWRFMIDARHQGRGYGRAALERLIEHVRGLPGVRRFLLSFVDDPEAGPEGFYARLGFRRTGRVVDGEVEMVLPL